MKVYYLRIPSSDFTKSSTAESAVWTSPVIDLYDNDYYKNYSITKSKYGANLLGDHTWTGRYLTGDDTTDAGRIDDGRFIDTSTRIDVISHVSNFANVSNLNASITWKLDYHSSPDSGSAFPVEWVPKAGMSEIEDILVYDTHRYAVFVVNFKYTQYTDFDYDLLVRVEIDTPVSLMLWDKSKTVMNKFPQWMSMREYDYLSALLYRIDGATPETAVPNTVGSAFINAVIGEYLDEVDSDIQYLYWQRFVDTIDLSQVAWVYRADAIPLYVYSIRGDGVELTRAASQREFEFEAKDYDDICWWDEENQIIFTRREYNALSINGYTYPQRIHQVWNFLDDLGASFDLKRLRNESNDNFQQRIKQIWDMRPGIFRTAYISLLRRELDLWDKSGSGGLRINNSGRSDSTTFAISPHSDKIDFSGDLDITIKLSLDDWDRYTNFLQLQPLYDSESTFYNHENQPIIGQFHPLSFNAEGWPQVDRDFGWKLEINDKAEVVWHWYDAETDTLQTAVLGVGNTVLNSLDAESSYWIRLTHYVEVDLDGDPEPLLDELGNPILDEEGNQIFNENPDLSTIISLLISEDGEEWTTIDTQIISWESPIDSLNLPIILGGLCGITDKAWQNFSGIIHNVTIRNVIDGDAIIDVDFEDISVSIPWSNSAQGQTGEFWHFSGDTRFVGGITRIAQDVQILEMRDIETNSDYFQPDGLPTQRFRDLIGRIDTEYPSTWGRFKFGHALWDSAGPDGSAFSYVPYALDATPPDPLNVQAGVGDGDDLFLYHPDSYTGAREFSYKFIVRGKQKVIRNEYRPVHLILDIYGQGDYEVYDNTPAEVWLSIEVVSATDNSTYCASFQLVAVSDVSASNPIASAASYANFSLFRPDGTLADLVYYEKGGSSTSPVYSGAHLRLDQIASITLKHGKYNPITHQYDNLQTTDTFEAWFTNDELTKLTYDSGAPSIANNAATPTALPQVQIAMRSKITSSNMITNGWHSEFIRTEIDINGGLPGQIAQDTSIPVPHIAWDPNVDESSRSIVVQIIDTNDLNQHGGYVEDAEGAQRFLHDAVYLKLNNSRTWTGGAQTLASDTETLIFSTDEGPLYPVQASSWDFFEKEQVTRQFDGVADENGPWRNGIPAQTNNTNWSLNWINLNREDFDLPSSSDYVVTWMGVTSDDSYVMVWIDNNIVKPATIDPPESNLTYPNNAIIEYLEPYDYATPYDDGGLYRYEAFRVYARVRPNPPVQWHPQLHTGWFYTQEDEYYSYARPRREVLVNDPYSPPTNEYVLQEPARQGAPIIVWTDEATPREFRQVYFVEDYATPVITLTNTQYLNGNGTNKLYLQYANLCDVTVRDLTVDRDVILVSDETPTNVITTYSITDGAHLYRISYRLDLSFYADHEYVDDDGFNRTKLVFDQSPNDRDVAGYLIDYEDSIFNPATPIDLPLSPLYTSINEGFVFINFNEETLDKIFLKMSSAKLVADGKDYLQITLNSVDQYGNPKPKQIFELKSTFGYLQDPQSVLNEAEFYIDARQYAPADGQVLRNLGTKGSTLNAQFGSSTGGDSADPKFLHYGGVQYVYLPNVEGNYIESTVPDVLREIKELDIRIRVGLDSWDSSTDQTLIARWDSNNNYGWQLTNNDRVLTFAISENGTNYTLEKSSTEEIDSNIFSNGSLGWLRATFHCDRGDGVSEIKFFQAEDSPLEPSIWTQVGASIVSTAVETIYDPVANITIGALADGTVQSGGSFYYAAVYCAVGSMIPDLIFDPTLARDPYVAWDADGVTWTLIRSTDGVRHAVLVARPVFVLGPDDYFTVADNDLLDFGTEDSFTIIGVVRNYVNATEARPVLQKKESQADNSPGYALWINDSNNFATFTVGDDTYKTEASGISSVNDGTLQVLTAICNRDLDTVYVYKNHEVGAEITTDLSVDTFTNSLPLRIGGESGSGTHYGAFEFYAAAIFRRALSEEEIFHVIDEINNSSRTIISTDHDGRAAVYLTATDTATDLLGTVYVEALTSTVGYNIELDDRSYGTASSNILTFDHMLGEGFDRMVLVGVGLESSSNEPLNSSIDVTFGAISMIPASSQHASNTSETSVHIAWFYLCDQHIDGTGSTQVLPESGTYPVVVSVTNRGNGEVQANCYSIFGAAQQAPEATQSSGTINDAAAYANTIATLTDKAWVFDLVHLANSANTLTPEANQIHVIENIGSNSGLYSSLKLARKAGLVRMGWNASATQARWAQSLLSIQPSLTTSRVSASMQFEIEPTTENSFSILAVAGVETIPADSVSTNSVLGKVMNDTYEPVSGATVYWQKSRSLYELYNSSVDNPKRTDGIKFENKGDQVYTSDSVALSMTNGIDLRICVKCDDWYESAQSFISKWVQTGDQRSYWFGLDANPQRKPTYKFSANGVMVVTTTASSPLPAVDEHIWLRVTHTPHILSTGTVKFYYNTTTAPDQEPTSWTTLSEHVDIPGSAIYDSTAIVSIGSDDGTSQLYGKVWRAQIRNATDVIASDLDFVNGWANDPITSLTKRSINDASDVTWTIANNAHFVPPINYGVAYTDDDGVFVIRPFVAATPTEPGYWFVSVSSDSYGSPPAPIDPIGDVVFWYEYPDIVYGYEPHQKRLRLPVQYATPLWGATPFIFEYALPSWYDEATPYAPATPVNFQWQPPKWHPVKREQQYFMGLMGHKRSGKYSQYLEKSSRISPEMIRNLFPHWREV